MREMKPLLGQKSSLRSVAAACQAWLCVGAGVGSACTSSASNVQARQLLLQLLVHEANLHCTLALLSQPGTPAVESLLVLGQAASICASHPLQRDA